MTLAASGGRGRGAFAARPRAAVLRAAGFGRSLLLARIEGRCRGNLRS